MNKKIAKDNSAVKDDSNVNDVSRRNAIRGITLAGLYVEGNVVHHSV